MKGTVTFAVSFMHFDKTCVLPNPCAGTQMHRWNREGCGEVPQRNACRQEVCGVLAWNRPCSHFTVEMPNRVWRPHEYWLCQVKPAAKASPAASGWNLMPMSWGMKLVILRNVQLALYKNVGCRWPGSLNLSYWKGPMYFSMYVYLISRRSLNFLIAISICIPQNIYAGNKSISLYKEFLYSAGTV